jgi:hypothetical protein
MNPAAIGNHIIITSDFYTANGVEHYLVVMAEDLQTGAFAGNRDFVIISGDLEFFSGTGKRHFFIRDDNLLFATRIRQDQLRLTLPTHQWLPMLKSLTVFS